MRTRTPVTLLFLFFPALLPADGILCSLGLGNASPISFATGCNTQLGFTNTFDWATLNPSPLSSSSGPTYQSATNPHTGSTPWSATSEGETVSATLTPSGNFPPYLQLDGNTAWVYNPQARISDNGYVYASAYNTAVALGFPTVNSAHPVAWYFGETLLTQQDPSPDAPTPISVSFSRPVSGVGFQIDTLSDPNFMATLIAYGASGQILGTYVIDTNGTNVGGPCASLYSSPGAPCATPAPWIGITDDELHLGANMISRITIVTNVPNFAIGTMGLMETPEPSTLVLVGAFLGLAAWRSRKSGRRIVSHP
jgi:hypothetical protein